MTTLEGAKHIFINAQGQYYLSITGRRAPQDSHIPSPSPTLVTLLEQAAEHLSMQQVEVQQAWDAVGMASQQQSDTDTKSTNASEPSQVANLTNNTENMADIDTTTSGATPAPEVVTDETKLEEIKAPVIAGNPAVPAESSTTTTAAT